MELFYRKTENSSRNEEHALGFVVAMATEMSQYNELWNEITRNKILGKVTKFGGKRK